MKRLLIISASTLLFLFVSICSAFADLDGFLAELNNRAGADMPGYQNSLSDQFSVTAEKVDWILKRVDKPADAFMCLQLGLMTGLHFEQVVKTYGAARGKGWGVIARELGIKPGSPEFHALKQGDFDFWGAGGKQKSSKPGKDKNPGKGKAKGNEKKF